MLAGIVKGVEKIVQVVGWRGHVMCLAGNDVKAYVLQGIDQVGRMDHISQKGGAVSARSHIQDTENPPTIAKVDMARSKIQIVAAIT